MTKPLPEVETWCGMCERIVGPEGCVACGDSVERPIFAEPVDPRGCAQDAGDPGSSNVKSNSNVKGNGNGRSPSVSGAPSIRSSALPYNNGLQNETEVADVH